MNGDRTPASFVRALDRLTIFGIAVGLALILQPFWRDGFRVGFFVTLGATVAQVVVAHLLPTHKE